MKILLSLICCVCIATSVLAQDTPKAIVVEHFTNTRCSICGANNPDFYKALAQAADVIHIAYHPSSPYSNCFFSVQNKSENDARTKFYGLYGGTPTFTVNGEEKFLSEVKNANVYVSYRNQKSSFSLTSSIRELGRDSAMITVSIKTLSAHNGKTTLYLAIVEDSIKYSAPNGESLHRDVFRKSATGDNPIAIDLPEVNSTKSFSYKVSLNSAWDRSKIKAIAILQDADKKILQAGRSIKLQKEVVSSLPYLNENIPITFFPNPASDIIKVQHVNINEIASLYIYDNHGRLLIKSTTAEINFSNQSAGLYFAKLVTKNGTIGLGRIIKL
jgi:hypothetical protein